MTTTMVWRKNCVLAFCPLVSKTQSPPLPLGPNQEYMVQHAEAGDGGDEEDKVDEDDHENDEDAGDAGDAGDGDDVCGD